MRYLYIVTLVFAVLLGGCAGQDAVEPLEAYLAEAAEALAVDLPEGARPFEHFRVAAAEAARRAGDETSASALAALEAGTRPEGPARELASRLLRRYVVARYGESIVADLREMVTFQTFKREEIDNWQAPEFLRQREWLEGKARDLGLAFDSVDGRVEELSLPGGERVIGVLTHGDVQGVQRQSWSYPPWEGQLEDGRIYGRGTEDDKGPIVTTLYVLAALRDSGWPLDATLRLMVANGEECCWDEIPYYLERQSAPDTTIGFDASYPVTHAQKAWCSIEMIAAPDAGTPTETAASPAPWIIESVDGGSGMSIIAEQAEARLRIADPDLAGVEPLRAQAEAWSAAHPPARVTVEAEEGNRVRVTALGRGGHSSNPEAGHNALGDLVAFLHGSVPSRETNGWSGLVEILGRLIGTETDGRSLGFAHTDAVMGPLTVNLALLDTYEGRPRARTSVRVPRGVGREKIAARMNRHADDFEQRHGYPLQLVVKMTNGPHYVDPDGPLVRTLLRVWEDVTGEPGKPVAIGGGTQARLFPDGVDFGPAMAMERYRGHGPDEYITVDELHRNAELTVAALWALAGGS